MAGVRKERPAGRLNAEAWDAGADARAAGKGREAMAREYASHKALARCWIEGWESAAPPAPRAPVPDIQNRRPEIVTRSATPSNMRNMWPAGKPLPTKYSRPPVPCPTCRRILDENGGRAVVVKQIANGVAYLRCRATRTCPDFKLEVEDSSRS